MQEAKRRPPKAATKNIRRLRRIRRGEAAAIPDRRVLDPPKNVRVAVDTIHDPFGISVSAQKEKKRRRDGSTAPGEGEWVSAGQPKITVLRSVRTDPLAWLHSHGQIDEADFLAGRHWQSLYERSHVGSVQAIDTSKEPVDGGRFSDPITESQRLAIMDLRAISLVIGKHPSGLARGRLIYDVLANGMFIKEAAHARGIVAERSVNAVAREFYECLAIMADHFGFSGTNKNNKKNKIRGWRQDGEEDNKNQEEAGGENKSKKG